MLLTLLYHRVGTGKYATPLPLLQKHFRLIKDKYVDCFPGDRLTRNSICLTFDDAQFDFYHLIFPLLKQLKLKAVIAAPVKYIQEETTLSTEERLKVPLKEIMTEGVYQTKFPYCTWKELKEMVETGLIRIASHSYSHPNLKLDSVDLTEEVILSKHILEKKLGCEIDTFVYPYGKMNRATHLLVKRHYKYAMRIGSAYNWNWQNRDGLIYRVSGDNMRSADEPFKRRAYLKQLGHLLLNSLLKK